jgi:hypothetical protein
MARRRVVSEARGGKSGVLQLFLLPLCFGRTTRSFAVLFVGGSAKMRECETQVARGIYCRLGCFGQVG